MGLFGSLFGGGINEHMETARETAGSVILDVRTPEEFKRGHIEGAINVSYENMTAVQKKVKSLDTPLFVYCLSGSRSSYACHSLRRLGYSAVTDMGGLNRWSGQLVR